MPALATRHFARYLGDVVLNVTLTTPFDGEAIVTATPTMVWTFGTRHF